MRLIAVGHVAKVFVGILLLLAILTQVSCTPRGHSGNQSVNPLKKIDPVDITIARFTGISSPVEGVYYETKDREIINLLYNRFSSLKANNPHIISMAGNLTTLHLLDSDETILAEIGINGDASTIVLRGKRDELEGFLMTESPETALFTFNFLKEHAPDVIAKLRESKDRNVEILHKKSYPIEE